MMGPTPRQPPLAWPPPPPRRTPAESRVRSSAPSDIPAARLPAVDRSHLRCLAVEVDTDVNHDSTPPSWRLSSGEHDKLSVLTPGTEAPLLVHGISKERSQCYMCQWPPSTRCRRSRPPPQRPARTRRILEVAASLAQRLPLMALLAAAGAPVHPTRGQHFLHVLVVADIAGDGDVYHRGLSGRLAVGRVGF
jgi:hypothetical protein